MPLHSHCYKTRVSVLKHGFFDGLLAKLRRRFARLRSSSYVLGIAALG
jgi:hypothetical protein